MKKLLVSIVIAGMLISVGGCMPSQSSANFRGQRITIGQSNDSVENKLGSPDWAAMNYSMKMASKFTGLIWGPRTIEWGYSDRPKSLVLWHEYGSILAIWLVDTNQL